MAPSLLRPTSPRPSLLLQVMMLRSNNQGPTLLSVYAACVYLALKVSDRVQHVGMLTAMLSHVLGGPVNPGQVRCGGGGGGKLSVA